MKLGEFWGCHYYAAENSEEAEQLRRLANEDTRHYHLLEGPRPILVERPNKPQVAEAAGYDMAQIDWSVPVEAHDPDKPQFMYYGGDAGVFGKLVPLQPLVEDFWNAAQAQLKTCYSVDEWARQVREAIAQTVQYP